jgi:hypothetical protein
MTDATYNLNGGFKPTLKRFADLNGPDFFRTPEWATHALIDNETFVGEIWEPACGDGAIARVLEQAGCSPSLARSLVPDRFRLCLFAVGSRYSFANVSPA